MALQRVEVKNPVGVNTSVAPADLPLNVWSSVNNVSFKNGKSQKAAGYERTFGATPPEVLHLIPSVEAGQLFWYESTPGRIFKTDGINHTEVTRTTGTYNSTVERGWTGCNLNTAIVLNNGMDAPQVKLYGEDTFKDLPNWPTDIRATTMRAYKNYLFALGIVRGGNEEPTTVKWSSPADPGQVPFTWDVTDFTNDAGENFLADTGGSIVDGRKLRDSFIIYKTDSVYSVNYIGGTYVFQFRKLFDDIGTLAVDCMAEFDGKHFVVGQGDVYVHNGVTKQSVISGVMREYLFSTISTDAYQYTQVIPDYGSTEMWICYCTPDNTNRQSCDEALVWNWKENTWSIRDLPPTRFAAYGIVDPQQPDGWDDAKGVWDTDALSWGELSYNPSKLKILLASPTDNAVYLVGDISTFGPQSFQSFLERTNINLGDDRKMKVVTSVTPHVSGKGEMDIYVGASYIQDGAIHWRGPFKYKIGDDQFKVDCRVSGRYLAIRFEAESIFDWRLNGYTIELAPTSGER